jgi:hypothetical protein
VSPWRIQSSGNARAVGTDDVCGVLQAFRLPWQFKGRKWADGSSCESHRWTVFSGSRWFGSSLSEVLENTKYAGQKYLEEQGV